MIERLPADSYKGIWEFEAEYGPEFFLLKVDEESAKKDLQAEYDHWEDQLSTYDPPIEHKRALWKMLAWLEELIERAVE